MEDIELVIRISQKWFDAMVREEFTEVDELCAVIQHGISLPKGHGRLKDFDKIEWYGCDFEGRACERANGDCSVCNFGECHSKQVRDLPTIIEADTAEREKGMCKMTFNVGDYIGDNYDRCWKVVSVTEKEYAVVYLPENIHKIISREEKPHSWSHDKDYADDYHLLRAYDHLDVIEYPIGSVWKCNKKNGFNNPVVDTVTIVDYAFSKGVFWVCNTKKQTALFIADATDLQPVVDKDVSGILG